MLIFSLWDSYAQCTIKKRVYANHQRFRGQGILAIWPLPGLAPGTINNAPDAVNGNIKTHSTLKVGVGALNLVTATQFLEFKSGENFVPAYSPVTVKLELPTAILGLLNSVKIQAFNNLSGSSTNASATAVGQAYSSASLADLINGSGIVEITIIPTVQYQGVSIQLGSAALTAGLELDVYHAYILENQTSPEIDCDSPIDVLSGVKAGTVIGGIASATGTVINPYNTIDNDLNSYAQLNATQLLSEVFETVIFSTPSQKNDVVEIILQESAGSLLNLNLLSNFIIQPYLGPNTAGSSLTNTSSFLSLSLLSGSAGNVKYLLRARIPEVFDRVEIKMAGVAGLLSSLRVYDVKRIISPTILSNNVEITDITVCERDNLTLSVDPQTCTTYKWYDSPTGGTALHTGSSYTINNISTTKTYYVEATRSNACNNSSLRVPVTINVNPAPAITLGTMPEVCELITRAILPFSNPLHTPTEYQIVWNQVSLDSGFTNTTQALPNNSQIEILIPNNASPAIYNGVLTVKNVNNCASTAKNIQVTIKPTPAAPNINIQTISQY